MSSNYKVNGHAIQTVADFDKLLGEIDTKTMQLWQRPLSYEALNFLLKRARANAKTESEREGFDLRIRQLSQKNDSHPNKELEAAQQKRDAKLRSLGFDIEDDETDKEPTEAMKETWLKREKRQEMYVK